MRIFYNRFLITIVCCLGMSAAFGQVNIVNNDTTICQGQTLMLHANSNGRVPIGIPLGQGDDDQYAPAPTPIGFPFTFFGNTYTQCVVSANGFITFDLTQADQYSNYVIDGPEDAVPGNVNVFNAIMAAYSDIDPSVPGGSIDYAIQGTAPNRRFIVSFCQSGLYSCNALKASFQIVIYETTNIIDLHLISQPSGACPGWNDGKAIQGVQNIDGTIGIVTPGRNWDPAWTAYNDSKRYTPNGPNDYTITDIPHAPVPDSLATITWYANGVPVGTGHDFNFTFTTSQQMVAMVTQCQDTTTDTIDVTVVPVPVITASQTAPTFCGATDGYITVSGLFPGATYGITYTFDGNTVTLMLTADGQGNVTIPNLGAGTYTSIYASGGGCTSNVIPTITLIEPLANIGNVAGIPPTLCRGTDAQLTIDGLLPDSTYTVRYTLDYLTSFQVLATASSTGVITLTGLSAGVYSQINVSLSICQSLSKGPVTIPNPAITADFTYILQPGCDEDLVRFTDISSGSAYPFEYVWKFGDDSSSTLQNPAHIYEDQGTYNVVLMITDSVCKDTIEREIVIQHPLVANFTVDNALICQGTAVNFTDASTFTGPATYSWNFGNGSTNSTSGASVSSVYPYAGDYTATMIISDFIGCKDTFTREIRVDSLTVINLSFADSTICAGEEVKINATYAEEGSTGAVWDFGDGIIMTTEGHNMDHSYERPGVYTISLTATGRVCPDVTASLPLNVQPQPLVNLGPDTSMCPTSAPIVLNDIINGTNPSAQWQWKRDNVLQDGENSFMYVAKDPAIYTALVKIGDCTSTDTIWVKNNCYIDVPNAFTPDGDNVNDYFFPRQWLSKGVTTFKLLVFNRWGQEIFSTTNISGRGWDGKFNGIDQPQGVYVYLIEATFKDGTSEKKQGNVTLLR